MSMANENFVTGGTGGAIFGGAGGDAPMKAEDQALGEEYHHPKGVHDVDPTRYPEGKEAPKHTWLSRFFPDPTSAGLAVAKTFYFFFYGAFGSLFPLMGVYFKQLGMDAAQAGFLSGIRPIVEYLAIPFWNNIASRMQKGKIMMLIGLACWIIFTTPIGHIHPPVVSCKYWNGSKVFLKLPQTHDSARRKRSVIDNNNYVDGESWGLSYPPLLLNQNPPPVVSDNEKDLPRALPLASHVVMSRVKRSYEDNTREWAEGNVVGVPGTSPQAIDFAVDQSQYGHGHHKQWVSPAWNNEVFEKAGVHKVFFLILLLVVIGEFFSSPAIALADSAVVTILGEENMDKYGAQRMFGSIGWGVTMFIMGIVLDHSKIFQHAKCEMNRGQRNYNVCFAVFSALMFLALVVATQLPFRYSGAPPPASGPANPRSNMQNGQQNQQKEAKESTKDKLKKAKVFAQQLRGMPEFVAVFKAMANLRMLMCMLVAWVMGIGIGLIFTFLFWHLQDFGGTPTLFGIASVINHLSEMFAYFYSFKIISKIGHIKVLALGLLCNVIRFIYISFITWPWLVLPFEFVQGITHAAVWAACCSFIAHNTDAELRPSAQGFLQGMHHGFGRFCGAVFGGMFIKEYGTVMVFRVYGGVCGVFLILFVLVNFYNRNEGGITSDLPDDVDPRNLAEESAHLAPHGVPGGAMPKVLSDAKMEEQDLQAVDQTGGNNPFLEGGQQDPQYNYTAAGTRIQGQEGQQGQYYGAGYSQAQSGYSSSGYAFQ